MRKALFVQFVILIAASSAWSAPSGITLLSQAHHIEGGAGTDSSLQPSRPGGRREEYSVTGPWRLYGSAEGIEVYSSGWTTPVSARSSAGLWGVYAYGSTSWTTWASAKSTYIFQPSEGADSFTLDVHGRRVGHPFEARVTLTLEDLTTATAIEHFTWPQLTVHDYGNPNYWYESFAWDQTYAVDPGHTYGLYLFCSVWPGDTFSMAYLQVGPIPAPGAILLATLGAGLVNSLRRRKTL